MKATTVTAGGALSAIATLGTPALVGIACLALVISGMLCWIISNRSRTENAVALITATRRVSDPADPNGALGAATGGSAYASDPRAETPARRRAGQRGASPAG